MVVHTKVTIQHVPVTLVPLLQQVLAVLVQVVELVLKQTALLLVVHTKVTIQHVPVTLVPL
jgi:hypothetical protein